MIEPLVLTGPTGLTATLYLGDCLEVLPTLAAGSVDAVVTDPVWPNALPSLIGAGDPLGLATRCFELLPPAKRLMVWLGCQSDPRFLQCVPTRWPFLRTCYLKRSVPGYNGRCLVTGDLLYAYGEWPASKRGRRVIPGECSDTSRPQLQNGHPAARSEKHCRWVVTWWTDEGTVVLDPFLGSGTTGVACAQTGRHFIGIEISEEYFNIAVRRIEAALRQPRLL